MVSCNEIRLGNYVLLNDQLKKITLINNDPGFADIPLIGYEGNEDNFIRCNSDNLQPVPLTNEVLKQCGFVFHDYFHFWQLRSNRFGANAEMDIDPDFNVIDFMRKPVAKKLTSLHQLQNLFFALQGFELPFVPPVTKPLTKPEMAPAMNGISG